VRGSQRTAGILTFAKSWPMNLEKIFHMFGVGIGYFMGSCYLSDILTNTRYPRNSFYYDSMSELIFIFDELFYLLNEFSLLHDLKLSSVDAFFILSGFSRNINLFSSSSCPNADVLLR